MRVTDEEIVLVIDPRQSTGFFFFKLKNHFKPNQTKTRGN